MRPARKLCGHLQALETPHPSTELAVWPTCHRALGTLSLWASHCIKNIQKPILQQH